MWIGPVEQSFIDKGWKKGRKEGLEQGLEQGRKEGAAALLQRQLVRRFGPLPQAVQRKLDKASLDQLEAWGDALPEAQTLKQVFGPA
jgi:flagellar biosynthesis/type III secretory pathway protein FliH